MQIKLDLKIFILIEIKSKEIENDLL